MQLAIIGPQFFGYLGDLATRLNARDVSATFYDERPSNSVGNKLFVRFAPQSVKDRALSNHIEVLTERVIAAKTTHVLLVSPEVVTPQAVARWKAHGISVSLYLWDSLRNKPRCRALAPEMAAIGSFDPEDCAEFGHALIPLYSAAPRLDPAPAKTHDVFYCTTLHSNRPQLLTKLRAAIAEGGWSANLFLFYHSLPLWMVRYANQPKVWPLLPLISTKSFSQADIAQATQAARVVIDIHHHAQAGLTMRTFEALSLDTILLTTNPNVVPQLPPSLHDRIVELDLDNPKSSLTAAIARKPDALSAQLLYSLSVDRFLDQILALLNGTPVAQAFAVLDEPIQNQGL